VKNLPDTATGERTANVVPLVRLIFDLAPHTSPSNEAAKSVKKSREPPWERVANPG